MYHKYVGKIIWCEIFWWFYWSLNLSLSHSSCFFEWVQPLFYGSNYSCILGVLGINYSYIFFSFLTWWLPYSFRCSSTCWDWHFHILDTITRCPSHVTPNCSFWSPILWEPNGLVLSLVASFFGGSLTWTRFCFASSRHSFKYHTNMSSFMCRSKGKCLVINLSYHTKISFIINSFFYNITYPFWLTTFYSFPPFMVSVWWYHWQSKYPFPLVPLQERTYNSPQHILGY